ncbi:MAG: Do family serine endopeptidase [Bacteroidota bacterium]
MKKIDLKLVGVVMAATIFGSVLTLGLYRTFSPEQAVLRVEHRNSLPSMNTKYTDELTAAPTDFTVAAEQVMPTVVHIKSTVVSRRTSTRNQQQIPDLFRDFFGEDFNPRGRSAPQPRVGSGSGVILSPDGYIVTNNHVIDQAEDIEVSLFDNRSFKAEIIGTDPSTDLALIKIDVEDLPYVAFTNSDEVKVGEWVLAIGNPFNLNSTVTAGIVSAKARNINILRDQAAIESFIQTDAAVNPGNSGGALVDLEGNLIGINTAIASTTGSFAGYSFAVPANLVRKVVEDLMQHGVVQRGYLGVIIRNVDGDLAEEKNIDVIPGVYVDSLMGSSAAAKAGVEIGDIITAVDGQAVNNISALQAAIGTHRPGDKVALDINRDGKARSLEVVLRNRSGNTDKVERKVDQLGFLGAKFEDLDSKTAQAMDLDGGVKVNALTRGKITEETNMREGFIITHVNGNKIANVEELTSALKNKKGGVMLEGVYENLPGSYYYAFGM